MNSRPHPSEIPVVACNLDAGQIDRLRQHPARPRVLQLPENGRPWDVPAEADILVTSVRAWQFAPREAPAGWPGNLKWIQTIAAGIDAFPDWAFDVPAFTTGRGITSEAIAEYVVAAILAHEKGFFGLPPVRTAADWKQRTLGQVSGRRLALFGFGSIGRQIAGKALGLGMKVTAATGGSTISGPQGVEQRLRLADLVEDADHLVICAPLTETTRRVLDASVLAAAKPGLHLINVSRGALVDNEALLEALDRGRLSAATLDVTDPEPLPDGHPFYDHPRIRLTPHISWNAPGNEDRTAGLVAGNLTAWIAGQPLRNQVSGK